MERTTIYLPSGGVLEVEHTQEFINRVCQWSEKSENEVLLKDIKDYIYESFKIALDSGDIEKIENI